jgi:hypothetical protein
VSNGAQIDYDALAKQAGAISSTPAGGTDYAALAKQAGAINSQPPAQGTATQPSTSGLQDVPGTAFRYGRFQAPTGTEQRQTQDSTFTGQEMSQDLKGMGAVAGSIMLPGVAPEAGWLAHATLTGIGAGIGTSGGQALSGQNPLTSQSLGESGTNAAMFGLTDVLFGALPALSKTKLGRSFINESVGATGRDVIYGNPAKALTDEGIFSPMTGDIEAVKAAGGNLAAAGGRLGEVAQRVQQLQPQLNQALSASTKTLKVADVIDKPLNDAMNDIIGNSAMTDAEKMAAISQLGGLQASLKQGLADEISPLKANQLKSLVGSRIRWNGTSAVGDEVKPAYQAVYASLKNAVNDAVPEVATLNERLTNLYAAQDDLVRLARNEEVSRGSGAMRGTIGTNLLGRAESAAGRFIPGAAAASGATGMAARPFLPALGSAANPNPQISNFPTVPLSSLLGRQ